jgi:hypothetical protein
MPFQSWPLSCLCFVGFITSADYPCPFSLVTIHFRWPLLLRFRFHRHFVERHHADHTLIIWLLRILPCSIHLLILCTSRNRHNAAISYMWYLVDFLLHKRFLPPLLGEWNVVRSLEAIHPKIVEQKERERERKVVCCLVATHHCNWCIPPCVRRYVVVCHRRRRRRHGSCFQHAHTITTFLSAPNIFAG